MDLLGFFPYIGNLRAVRLLTKAKIFKKEHFKPQTFLQMDQLEEARKAGREGDKELRSVMYVCQLSMVSVIFIYCKHVLLP